MVCRVHINRHIIAANHKHGQNRPPITIVRRGKTHHAREVALVGEARVVYRPEKPLKCGARLWIECDDAVFEDVLVDDTGGS